MQRTIFAIFLLSFVLIGCDGGNKVKPDKSTIIDESPTTRLVSRSKVIAVLLDRLESGLTPTNTVFRFAVLNDVKSRDGVVVIPAGTIGKGKVRWSRRASVPSVLINQPARLAVELESLYAVDGTEVFLNVSSPSDEGVILQQYEFNRRNTEPTYQLSDAVVKCNERQRESLELFAVLGIRAFEDQDVKRDLREVSESENLKESAKAFDNGVATLLERSGREYATEELKRLAPDELTVILQLAAVADKSMDRLGKMLKARQIVAPVGCEIPALVYGEYSIKIAQVPERGK